MNEILLVDYPSLVATPLTVVPGFLHHIDLTAAGDRVVFASIGDLVPGRNPDGNGEIFIVDSAGNLEQVTDTSTGHSDHPTISSDGQHIAFSSSSELSAPGGGNEVIVGDLASRTFLSILQGGRSAVNPSISADGQRIAFGSDEDPVGHNPANDFELLLAECTLGPPSVVAVPTLRTADLALLALLLFAAASWQLRRAG